MHRERLPNGTDTWLTPRWLVERLGPFDLDPATPKERPWNTARRHYSEDGQYKEWKGRVWLNPPYSHPLIEEFVCKLARHGNGIALVYARTDTKWFRHIWHRASGIMFVTGRIDFYRADGKTLGSSPAPSVLASFDSGSTRKNFAALKTLQSSGQLAGRVIKLS